MCVKEVRKDLEAITHLGESTSFAFVQHQGVADPATGSRNRNPSL